MVACGSQQLSVSVIIPTYNRAAFIAAAVESHAEPDPTGR